MLKFVVVLLPVDVHHEVAACCIGDGVRAYIALQHLGHISFGDTVLIMDAATSFGSLAVQLAHVWGAKVCFVCSVPDCNYSLSLPSWHGSRISIGTVFSSKNETIKISTPVITE